MKRAIDIGLLAVFSLVLAFTGRPFRLNRIFDAGAYFTCSKQPMAVARTLRVTNSTWQFGMVLAILGFTGVFVAGYIDQQTIEIYEQAKR